MQGRLLSITLQPDWQAGLRAAAKAAKKTTYLGEVLAPFQLETTGQRKPHTIETILRLSADPDVPDEKASD